MGLAEIKELFGFYDDPLAHNKKEITRAILNDEYSLITPSPDRLVFEIPQFDAIRFPLYGKFGGAKLTYMEHAKASQDGFDDNPDESRSAEYGMLGFDNVNVEEKAKANGELQGADEKRLLYHHSLDEIVRLLIEPIAEGMQNCQIECSDRDDTEITLDGAGNYSVKNFDLSIRGTPYKVSFSGGPHDDGVRGSYLHTLHVFNKKKKKVIVDLKPEAMIQYNGTRLKDDRLHLGAMVAKRLNFNTLRDEIPTLVSERRFQLYTEPAQNPTRLVAKLNGLQGNNYTLVCEIGAQGLDDFPDRIEDGVNPPIIHNPDAVDNDQRLFWGPLMNELQDQVWKQIIGRYVNTHTRSNPHELRPGAIPAVYGLFEQFDIEGHPPLAIGLEGTHKQADVIKLHQVGVPEYLINVSIPWNGGYVGTGFLPFKPIIGEKMRGAENNGA